MPIISISNGTIIDIFSQKEDTFVTITYEEGSGNRRTKQTVRLVAGPRTVILSANGIPVPAAMLSVGMTINATFSSAMTRSIPPQAVAYLIRITGRPLPEETTSGIILNVDRRNRSFTLINERDFSSIIQFNVSEDTRIYNRLGRPISFSDLTVGMRVQVRHANFMTASIPPQTTAFEIRVL
ncbi:MAG: hypothetical protein SPK68_11010 [Lachnospiraceae bacterium]|nr:hypothetical protein [Lachnospiraceae bacterium]